MGKKSKEHKKKIERRNRMITERKNSIQKMFNKLLETNLKNAEISGTTENQ